MAFYEVEISNEHCQSQSIILPNGDQINLEFQFWAPMRQWRVSLLMKDTKYKLEILNRPVLVGGNLIRNERKIFPYGLLVMSTNGIDPTTDYFFKEGWASFFIIDGEDLNRF